MDAGTGQDDSGPSGPEAGDPTPTVEGSRAVRRGEASDPTPLVDVTGDPGDEDPVVIDLRDGVDTIAVYEADRARRAADASQDRR